MSLKFKALVVVGAAILLLVALGAGALFPILRSFDVLEQAEARRNSARVLHAIEDRVAQLRRTARDWSEWSDTYAFVQGDKDDFVESNLYFESLETLRVHFMVFYDLNGQIRWSGMFDLATGEPIEIAEFAPGVLRADDPLLANRTAGAGPGGVMETSAGPAIVVSNPILPSEAPEAPAMGTLVVGRLLDGETLREISEQVQVAFDLIGAADKAPVAGFASHDLGGDALVVQESLPDLAGGTPRFVLHTYTPRDISALGDRAIALSLLLIGITGLVALAAIWAMLHWLVLRPVLRLSQQVLHIGDATRPDSRVAVDGHDEIAVLAREFNRTLARLDDARRQLAYQSHRAGMNEMAAGVLHNLRNGLSPLVGRVDGLAAQLRQGAGGELARAGTELADPALPPERRRRLADYVAATGAEIVAAREEQVSELAAISRMAHTVGEIITGQDRIIYASETSEAVAVAVVLDEAISLLPAAPQRRLSIEIDRNLAQLPAVQVSSVTLLQVLHNLLVNAGDSVRAAHRDDGRVRIAGALNGGMVEIEVTDNGVGLAEANRTRIFERGITSKVSGRGGVGLHWCANAVGAVGGRLWATSAGPGAGATFHLQLPLANPSEAAA